MYIVRFRFHRQGGELLASVLVLARWWSIGERAFDVGVLPANRTLLPVAPTGVAIRPAERWIWQSRPLPFKWQDWVALNGRISSYRWQNNGASGMPPVAAFHCNQHLRPDSIGECYCVGIFAAAKMTHLSRDKTATKMGHPIVAAWSDVGHSAKLQLQSKCKSRSLRDDKQRNRQRQKQRQKQLQLQLQRKRVVSTVALSGCQSYVST